MYDIKGNKSVELSMDNNYLLDTIWASQELSEKSRINQWDLSQLQEIREQPQEAKPKRSLVDKIKEGAILLFVLALIVGFIYFAIGKEAAYVAAVVLFFNQIHYAMQMEKSNAMPNHELVFRDGNKLLLFVLNESELKVLKDRVSANNALTPVKNSLLVRRLSQEEVDNYTQDRRNSDMFATVLILLTIASLLAVYLSRYNPPAPVYYAVGVISVFASVITCVQINRKWQETNIQIMEKK